MIQGYAEGLKENITDDEESKDFYCEVIADEAKKMNAMVKNFSHLTRLSLEIISLVCSDLMYAR